MAYLDNNATMATLDSVVDRQSECLLLLRGNPSAKQHSDGELAFQMLESSRRSITDCLGVPPTSFIFTSGATESISIGILGFLSGQPIAKRRVAVWGAEHKAVLEALRFAKKHLGAEVATLNSTDDGNPNYLELEICASRGLDLVCIAAANNETGILPNLELISSIVKTAGAKFFCDTTQILGKQQWGNFAQSADFLVLSGHKFGGPRGIGGLIVDRELQERLDSPISGGGQERGIRGGTNNVPGAAGLAHAVSIIIEEEPKRLKILNELDAYFLSKLNSYSNHLKMNTGKSSRLKNTFNFQILGADAVDLMGLLPQHQFSIGSACSHGSESPSHVLLSMGLSIEDARSSVRVSLSSSNTVDEIDEFITDLVRAKEVLQA